MIDDKIKYSVIHPAKMTPYFTTLAQAKKYAKMESVELKYIGKKFAVFDLKSLDKLGYYMNGKWYKI